MSDKAYEITVECQNCKEDVEIVIPLGVTVEDYLGKNKVSCTKCKCATLAKRSY